MRRPAMSPGASGRATRLLLALCVLPLWAAAQTPSRDGGQAKPAAASPPPLTVRSLVADTCHELQRHAESVLGSGVVRSAAESAVLFLESLLGQKNVYTVAMFLETVIRFLAEGAASGLNVIAVYVAEILRVTGFDVSGMLPRFTPEGVAAIAQWGLLALIGYWVLTIVLHLLICVLKRVFWVVKTVLALWLFGLIVTDKTATADVTAVRLGGLVLGCVLLTLLSSSCEKSLVDQRLSSLEGRLRAVEKRKAEQ